MKSIMQNVFWSLGSAQKYDSYDEFITKVTEYNNIISEDDNEWDCNKVICTYPKVKIIFEARWKDEDDLLEIIVEGKNGRDITMGEMLFALNNDSAAFFDDTDSFFEGLTETKSEDNIPTYHLLTGT